MTLKTNSWVDNIPLFQFGWIKIYGFFSQSYFFAQTLGIASILPFFHWWIAGRSLILNYVIRTLYWNLVLVRAAWRYEIIRGIISFNFYTFIGKTCEGRIQQVLCSHLLSKNLHKNSDSFLLLFKSHRFFFLKQVLDQSWLKSKMKFTNRNLQSKLDFFGQLCIKSSCKKSIKILMIDSNFLSWRLT